MGAFLFSGRNAGKNAAGNLRCRISDCDKNEIAKCFSSADYSPQAVKALMKSPKLLQDIYEEWMEKDVSHAEELRKTVADVKAYMVKTEKILSGKER